MNNNNSKIWFDVIEKNAYVLEVVGNSWIWFDVFERDIINKAERAEAPPACVANLVSKVYFVEMIVRILQWW